MHPYQHVDCLQWKLIHLHCLVIFLLIVDENQQTLIHTLNQIQLSKSPMGAQVLVATNEQHKRKSSWLFSNYQPLYSIGWVPVLRIADQVDDQFLVKSI